MRSAFRWGFCHAALAVWLAAMSVAVSAEENLQLFEQEIEAGLLYNFLKYTNWPAEHNDETRGNMVVCLFGGDPFGGHLQSMAGRTVNQHSIEIRIVNRPENMNGCSLLYIDAGRKSDWPQLAHGLNEKQILTVGNFDAFARSGGMIEFTKIEDRIGVKINLDAVTAAHLTVQDRLLRLASLVHASPD
ncbi:MAG TPA: YfiR family protein [Rhizomicrobium sp.]|jgi:hypothetical protein|nr:YfiR family protein [Rhizomicrobium sp.]